jgi:hypothetical protein
MSLAMSLAAESEKLLREIRELRSRRQQQLDLDLAEIERAYEQQLLRIGQQARRGQVLRACLWTATLLIGAVVYLTS